MTEGAIGEVSQYVAAPEGKDYSSIEDRDIHRTFLRFDNSKDPLKSGPFPRVYGSEIDTFAQIVELDSLRTSLLIEHVLKEKVISYDRIKVGIAGRYRFSDEGIYALLALATCYKDRVMKVGGNHARVSFQDLEQKTIAALGEATWISEKIAIPEKKTGENGHV